MYGGISPSRWYPSRLLTHGLLLGKVSVRCHSELDDVAELSDCIIISHHHHYHHVVITLHLHWFEITMTAFIHWYTISNSSLGMTYTHKKDMVRVTLTNLNSGCRNHIYGLLNS